MPSRRCATVIREGSTPSTSPAIWASDAAWPPPRSVIPRSKRQRCRRVRGRSSTMPIGEMPRPPVRLHVAAEPHPATDARGSGPGRVHPARAPPARRACTHARRRPSPPPRPWEAGRPGAGSSAPALRSGTARARRRSGPSGIRSRTPPASAPNPRNALAGTLFVNAAGRLDPRVGHAIRPARRDAGGEHHARRQRRVRAAIADDTDVLGDDLAGSHARSGSASRMDAASAGPRSTPGGTTPCGRPGAFATPGGRGTARPSCPPSRRTHRPCTSRSPGPGSPGAA